MFKIIPVILVAFFVLLPPAEAAFKDDVSKFDPASAECVECHPNHHEKTTSHPVGGDYEKIAEMGPVYHPEKNLPLEIRLYDGKITCLTCHVPYEDYNHKILSKERAEATDDHDPMLVIDNTGSKLCLACHRK